MAAPFLTPRIIPKIGLAPMAITMTNITQCKIENDSIIVTFARVQASRVSSFRYFVGQRGDEVQCRAFIKLELIRIWLRADESTPQTGSSFFRDRRRPGGRIGRGLLPEVKDRHVDEVKLAPDGGRQLERIGIVQAHGPIEFIDAVGNRARSPPPDTGLPRSYVSARRETEEEPPRNPASPRCVENAQTSPPNPPRDARSRIR
jgi:hypothetical protein